MIAVFTRTVVLMHFLSFAAGLAATSSCALEVASAKRSSDLSAPIQRSETETMVRYGNIPLGIVIERAYGMKHYQIKGPSTLSERYDLAIRLADGCHKEDIPLVLQHLLAERFRLIVHYELKPTSVYALAVKGGLKAQAVAPGHANVRAPGLLVPSMGRVHIDGPITMEYLATALTAMMGRPVLNRTDISGEFDIKLDGYALPSENANMPDPYSSSTVVTLPETGMSIFAALRQLGLEMKNETVDIQRLVVDAVDKEPTEN
jgi:uncharacterized protein (TIGR03435 family)